MDFGDTVFQLINILLLLAFSAFFIAIAILLVKKLTK